MKRHLRAWVGLLGAGALATVGLVVPATTASASSGQYGAAEYQVEVSVNPPGEGVWFWAALYSDGTGDYQEADCVHLGGGHIASLGGFPDGAAHNTGDNLSWTVVNDQLVISGIAALPGGAVPLTITVPMQMGHSNTATVIGGPINITLTDSPYAQVQIAP